MIGERHPSEPFHIAIRPVPGREPGTTVYEVVDWNGTLLGTFRNEAIAEQTIKLLIKSMLSMQDPQ
jgi:hypothetical protein